MSIDSAAIDLTHHFLIAMPGLEDALFEHSVVYVCEHNDRGALGLIINKPSDLPLAGLFEKIALKLNRTDLTNAPVFHGGPVQTERGFVLHEPMGQGGESVYSSTLVIKGETLEASDVVEVMDGDEDLAPRTPARLEMTTSKDVLEAMAEGAGPKRALVTLGYATWGKGQLESELAENSWLSLPATSDIIFATPAEQRLCSAAAQLGIDMNLISAEAGHA